VGKKDRVFRASKKQSWTGEREESADENEQYDDNANDDDDDNGSGSEGGGEHRDKRRATENASESKPRVPRPRVRSGD
jgi:hypothetical protein